MDEFTKEDIKQYEIVRQSGACNMLDRTKVGSIAKKLGYEELQAICRNSRKYVGLLTNYGELMKKHNIGR